jgi:oligopeptide/dipeptide ABC transporter ATP-binding protein
VSTALLSVRELSVRLPTTAGYVHAVTGLDITVDHDEFLGVVGESGCGKSTLALALLRLLPPGTIEAGSIRLGGQDLRSLGRAQLRALRGEQVGYVPQEPLSALDPTFGVGEQVAEAIRAHRAVSRRAARAEAIRLMTDVGIPEAGLRYAEPPHAFSGGMRQRVAIAIAIANKPALIIADEPTTALDVTTQRHVLRLLSRQARQSHAAVVFISHDLAVVSQVCDRVAVLYAGRLVEVGPAATILSAPRHPYTQALLRSVPSAAIGRGQLRVLPGEVPDLLSPGPGCPFAARCPQRMARCDVMPPPTRLTPHWSVACWLPAAPPAPEPAQ